MLQLVFWEDATKFLNFDASLKYIFSIMMCCATEYHSLLTNRQPCKLWFFLVLTTAPSIPAFINSIISFQTFNAFFGYPDISTSHVIGTVAFFVDMFALGGIEESSSRNLKTSSKISGILKIGWTAGQLLDDSGPESRVRIVAFVNLILKIHSLASLFVIKAISWGHNMRCCIFFFWRDH